MGSIELSASRQELGHVPLHERLVPETVLVCSKILREKNASSPASVCVWLTGIVEYLNRVTIKHVTDLVKEKYGDKTEITFILPVSTKNINVHAFYDMKENLKKLKVHEKNQIYYICNSAFKDCKFLTSIESTRKGPPFPKLAYIGPYAFSGCESLKTPLFDEQTPIRNIEDGAFAKSNVDHIRLPETWCGDTMNLTPSFQDCSVKSFFIPSNSVLEKLTIQNNETSHPVVYIDFNEETKTHDLILCLKAIGENFQYSKSHPHDETFPSPDCCSKMILGSSGNPASIRQEDSVFLWDHLLFERSQDKILSHKICFSSPVPFENVAQNAYQAYKNIKTQADGNSELLDYLSPQFIFHALSQNAVELLKNLKNEELRSFVYECFLLVRFLCGVPDRDLYQAYPERSPVSDFIKNCFLIKEDDFIPESLFLDKDTDFLDKDTEKGNEEQFAKIGPIVDMFRNDGLDNLQDWISRTNFSVREKLTETDWRLNPHIFDDFTMGIHSFDYIIHHLEEDFSPYTFSLTELAALFGAAQIFKFLVGNSVPISKNCFAFACFSGNYDIIHLIEEHTSVELSAAEVDYLIRHVPDPWIADYLRNNY